ncbi:MAG: autotransporter outer membrane beta-barrel domain-containing protein [Vicinamibacterales bacterium]
MIGTSKIALRVVALAALSVAAGERQLHAQDTPPRSQDEQLRTMLGLGDADGCSVLLGVADNGGDVAQALDGLAALGQIGNELRAICSPSAVTSASSTGGGITSIQGTKSMAQFSFVRSLVGGTRPAPAPKPKPSPSRSFLQVPSPDVMFAEGAAGAAIFGSIELTQNDRSDTAFESGYDGSLNGLTVGADYVAGRAIAGGWIGRQHQEADFTRFSAITDDTGDVLSEPGVLSTVCGGLSNGGSFEQSATRFGGFAGWGVGAAAFVDASIGWVRRDHDYARNVCVIESQGELTFENGVLRHLDGQQTVDDIYAGTVTGLTKVRETNFSVRTGGNVGTQAVVFTPRTTLAVSRATTEAYSETGRNTVATPVTPVDGNDGNPFTRVPGGPIGYELAFEERSRTSVMLEAGADIGFAFGALMPFASGFWRHEFNDDFHTARARFVQDLRAEPMTFGIGYDRYDANALLFGFGITAFAGDRVTARFEFSQLQGDALFDARTITAQARVQF